MKRPISLKIVSLTLLLTASILMTGCDFAVDIDIPVPPHESQLVVNALFETGAPLTVHLGRSVEVGKAGNPLSVENGRVALYMDGQFVETLRPNEEVVSGQNAHFVSEHVMLPNRLYRIEAEADGLRPVSAEERTLPLPTVELVSYTRGTPEPYGEREDQVVLRILDAAGRNYYRLSFLEYHREHEGDGRFYLQPFRSDDPVLRDGQLFDLFDIGGRGYVHAAMFSNAAFDGQAHTITLHVIVPPPFQGRTSEHYFRLESISELYYRYARARQAIEDNDGNPFAEPVMLPSNVVGGLGIFVGRAGRNIPL